jgi:hypothetical protein
MDALLGRVEQWAAPVLSLAAWLNNLIQQRDGESDDEHVSRIKEGLTFAPLDDDVDVPDSADAPWKTCGCVWDESCDQCRK